MTARTRIRSLVLLAVLAVPFAVAAPVHAASNTSWGRLKALYGPETPDARVPSLGPSYVQSLEDRGVTLIDAQPLRDHAGAVMTLGWARDGDLVLDIVLPGGRVALSKKEDINAPRSKCVQTFAACWSYCDRRYAGEGFTIGGVTFPSFAHIACRIDCEIDLGKCVWREMADQILTTSP